MPHISKSDHIYSMNPLNTSKLQVKQGTLITIDTLDCFAEQAHQNGYSMAGISFEKVNPATGPIYIEDVNPGDLLEIEIIDITLGTCGVMASTPLFGALKECLVESEIVPYHIKDNAVQFDDIAIPIAPMIGVIGVAPKSGDIANGSPGEHGANMDCKNITIGSKWYLTAFHPGGLLSVGDLHAVMADGELSGTGVEISGTVQLKVTVVKPTMVIPTPCVVNGTVYSFIASATTLDKAVELASKKTLNYLDQYFNDKGKTVRFMSLYADAGICQVVNPLKTAKVTVDMAILK